MARWGRASISGDVPAVRSFIFDVTGCARYTFAVTSASSRLAWIDWMRGLACVLMFQTHCYDAWLGGDARNTSFLKGSQRLGTLPAPLFLFLAGVSFALRSEEHTSD